MARQTLQDQWILWLWNNKIIILTLLISVCSLHQMYIVLTSASSTELMVNEENEIPILQHRTLSTATATERQKGNDSDAINLKRLRTNPWTPRCNEETDPPWTRWRDFKRLNVSRLPSNWVSFANRCQLNRDLFESNIRGDFDFLWMNSEVGYLHNYKCGGSTVQDALSKLSNIDLRGDSLYNDVRRGWVNLYGATPKFMRQSGWNRNPDPWYRKMEDSFLFTFVRDPVDKFLSSFYEVHTRNHSARRVWTKLGVDSVFGIDRMRKLLQFFQRNIEQHVIGNGIEIPIRGESVWRGEPHFHPQMLFLWRRDFHFLPFDYIGEMVHFEEALNMILDEFSDYFHKHKLDATNHIVRHLRQREPHGTAERYKRKDYYVNAKEKDYFITRQDLSDSDVEAICDVYWMDYLCLPFEVPEQCDIEAMMDKYYGHFLTYNDCYYS